MKWFVQMTVKWTNNLDDYIFEQTAMPKELIRKVSGQLAVNEENLAVYPINHCPEPSVNRASFELIGKHRTAFPNKRQILQRQVLRIVPVTRVESEYEGNPFSFIVYGSENAVYTENYPMNCCCGCTIL